MWKADIFNLIINIDFFRKSPIDASRCKENRGETISYEERKHVSFEVNLHWRNCAQFAPIKLTSQ